MTEARRPIRSALRALAFGAGLVFVVVGSTLSFYRLQTTFPNVNFGILSLLAAVAFVGPLPFRPTMDPVISFWPLLVFWIAVSTVFVRRTRYVLSIGRLLVYAVSTVLLCLLPMAALAQYYIASDWRRGPGAEVQQVLLGKTPLGSSMEDVLKVIEQNGWALRHVDEKRGFPDQRTGPPRPTGSKHIQADAGDYLGVPFISNATIYWGFDDSGKLIDAWVWRTTDAP